MSGCAVTTRRPARAGTRRSCRLLLTAGVVAAALSPLGCATTGYHPRGTGSYGYEHTQVSPDTYAVRYRARLFGGDRGTGDAADKVLLQLWRRCAELTLEQGHDYFIVLNRTLDEQYGTGDAVREFLSMGTASTRRLMVEVTIRLFRGAAPETRIDEHGQEPGERQGYDAVDARALLAELKASKKK